MIALPSIGIASAFRLLGKIWWAFPIAGLFIALMITRATLAGARADHAAYDLGMTKAAAAATAIALEEERKRAAINQEIDRAHQENMAGLRVSYERRLRALTGNPAANLPRIPDPASGFDGASCRDGFLGLSTETAVALMLAADENTLKLIDLQAWVRKQGEVR